MNVPWLNSQVARCSGVWMMVLACCGSSAAEVTSIDEVCGKLDPSSGLPRDPGTEVTIRGVVGARWVGSETAAVAFVLNPGKPALMVYSATPGAMALLEPRHEVTLTGKLGMGPLGGGLELVAGTLRVSATNKSFGASEPRGAGFLADAASLAGRFVQLTNVTFVDAVLGGEGLARVKGVDGGEAIVRVGKAAAGRPAPTGPQDVFGFVVRSAEGWQVVAARFLTVDRRDLVALATRHTCITCHNPEMKVVGPAYREVAQRNRNDPDAAGKLIAQMRTGGSGKWGVVPMLPFEGKIPPEEMRRLADWILGYRWDWLLTE